MAGEGVGGATLVAQRLPPHEQLGRLRGLGKYETRRLKLDEAARLANIDLDTFADACVSRKIRVHWYRAEDVQSDLETLKKVGLRPPRWWSPILLRFACFGIFLSFVCLPSSSMKCWSLQQSRASQQANLAQTP